MRTHSGIRRILAAVAAASVLALAPIAGLANHTQSDAGRYAPCGQGDWPFRF